MSPKGDPTFDFHFKKFSQEVSLNECFILGRFRVQTLANITAIFTEDTFMQQGQQNESPDVKFLKSNKHIFYLFTHFVNLVA